MIILSLHSSQSPEAVLAALCSQAGEWRSSQIPEALRRAGVTAVESKIRGASCTLGYCRSWYGPVQRGVAFRARAAVLPAPDGTMVQVTAGHEVRAPAFAAVLFIMVAVAGVLLSPIPPWLIIGLFAVVFALPFLVARGMNRHLARRDPEAEYLIARIEAAVAGTEAVNFPAPAA